MNKKVAVIGGGIGGLAAAALLAHRGFDVDLFEKNQTTGGRARYWNDKGFRFDMGPSWYLMPEVFERYFSLFGKKTTDFYQLQKLDTSYRVFFSENSPVDITSNPEQVGSVFESFEKGGARKLDKYLKEARRKYKMALSRFLYCDFSDPRQLMNPQLLLGGIQMNLFGSLEKMVSKTFLSRQARQILQYPMVFLGTKPRQAPAMYSLLSHVDLEQGVFYPEGGLAGVASALAELALQSGVKIHTHSEVGSVEVRNGRAVGIHVGGNLVPTDAVLANADYHHVETKLIEKRYSSYPEEWWRKRKLAPSMFILFLGVRKRLPSLCHHNLYFSQNWDRHFSQIFDRPEWPQEPCFYLSAISKTDRNAAPEGCENLFLLIPVAPGMDDTEEARLIYSDSMIKHLERVIGEPIRPFVEVQRTYSHKDFAADYNAYRGTALGLSHTLEQTAFFRPSFKSKKVRGLFFTGQYTQPGIGVPMVLIAAEIATRILTKDLISW